MKTKRFLIIAACCLTALLLAGCSDGNVQSTVSRIKDDVSETVSRVESALDPDDNSSGFPDDEEKSSMPDYSSSQGGGVNSGDDNITNGTESDLDSDLDSGLDSDLDSGDENSAGNSTKDL